MTSEDRDYGVQTETTEEQLHRHHEIGQQLLDTVAEGEHTHSVLLHVEELGGGQVLEQDSLGLREVYDENVSTIEN